MEIVGWVATGVVGVVVVSGVVFGLASLPDIRRYLRIRGM
jgi:hypothetical protein